MTPILPAYSFSVLEIEKVSLLVVSCFRCEFAHVLARQLIVRWEALSNRLAKVELRSARSANQRARLALFQNKTWPLSAISAISTFTLIQDQTKFPKIET